VGEIIEQVLGRQGARLKEIDALMALPTPQSPRTMLKLVVRFTNALERVRTREEEKVAGKHPGEEQLPADYPFWLLAAHRDVLPALPEGDRRLLPGPGRALRPDVAGWRQRGPRRERAG
jgi:hypothetical protein